MEGIAAAVPLQVWQDPQGDVALKHTRSECAVYFGCWTNAGEPPDCICELQFENAWAVRGYCSEYLPYLVKQGLPRSSVYEIANSTWLRQASEQRLSDYPRWRDWDKKKYHHYVIHGHDNYYEILASGYSEKQISCDEAGELKR